MPDSNYIPASEDTHIDPLRCLASASGHVVSEGDDEIVIITRSSSGVINMWSSDNLEKTRELAEAGVAYWLTPDGR